MAIGLAPFGAPLRRVFITLPTVTGIEIVINGVDLSGEYQPGSLGLADELESRGTADFVLIDKANTLDFSPGESVDIRLNGTLLFSGTLQNISERWPAMDKTTLFHTLKLKAIDHNALADRFLVAKTFSEGQLPGAIVESLRADYLDGEGVTAGNIENGGITLGLVSFNYQSVSDCLDDLAELIGFIWFIDENRALNFQARDTTSASFGYSDSSLPIRRLVKEKTRINYRNRQYLRAGRDLQGVANTESFAGDGERRTFTVGLPIGEEPTITLDDVAQTVGINGVDTGKDWYWQKDSNSIEQESEDDPITDAEVLAVTYKGLIAIIVQADLEDQQEARADAEGGSGIYERIEDDERIESSQFALDRANGLVSRFGRLPEILKITTDNGRLRAGQVQNIELTRESISGDFLIQSVRARDQGNNTLVYSYKCVDGALVGGWVAFFRRLADGGRRFEIRDNEVFIIMRQKDETLTMDDAGLLVNPGTLSSFTLDPYSVFLVAATAEGYANPNGSYIGTGWTNADGTRRGTGATIGSIRDGS